MGTPLTREAIELAALVRARGYGLHGPPAHLTAWRMALDEARRRLPPVAYDPRDPATPVWLVVIHGRILLSAHEYDSMYLLLDTTGRITSLGALTNGRPALPDRPAPPPPGPPPPETSPRRTHPGRLSPDWSPATAPEQRPAGPPGDTPGSQV